MSNAFDLTGRIAVVTGAGKGIGRGIALCLARAGADVAVAARSATDLDSVAAEVRALGRRAIVVATDVTVTEQLENLAAQATQQLGHIDIWGQQRRRSARRNAALPDAHTGRSLGRATRSQPQIRLDIGRGGSEAHG